MDERIRRLEPRQYLAEVAAVGAIVNWLLACSLDREHDIVIDPKMGWVLVKVVRARWLPWIGGVR